MRGRNTKLGKKLTVVSIVTILIGLITVGTIKGLGANKTSVVKNLEMISDKKDVYQSRDTIAVKGEWELPNDTEEKTWGAGDTFSVQIPDILKSKGFDIS